MCPQAHATNMLMSVGVIYRRVQREMVGRASAQFSIPGESIAMR